MRKTGRRFPLRFSERRLLLILLDLFALNGALLVSLSLWPEYRLTWRLFFQYPQWFLLLSILWFFIGSAFNVYDLRLAGRFSTTSGAIAKAGLITCGIYLLIPYIPPALSGFRFPLFSFFILALGFLLVGRTIYLLTLKQLIFNCRALIFGTGPSAQLISQTIQENTNGIFQVEGFIQTKFETYGKNANLSPSQNCNFQACILGGQESVIELIKSKNINALILANDQRLNSEMLQILTDCAELGVEIIPMPILYEELTGRVPIEYIGQDWQMAMPFANPLTKTYNRFLKRASDIILASLGCLCLAPFFPFIALAIYIESPGSIFYTQTRVGRGGKIFKAYKFRSMVPDAERDRPVWAEKNDPRVTRVGRILRKTHVDEFPQFWNILKGDMSAVGPRPERPEFVEELAKEIPFYRVRHAVKPGMAGWGLVKYGYASSKEDSAIKLQYDLYYIKHWSLWFDLIILFKTIIDTITFRGRA